MEQVFRCAPRRAQVMLGVWALDHIEVRGEHSLQKTIGGGGAWEMTKAQEKSGPHIHGYTCRGGIPTLSPPQCDLMFGHGKSKRGHFPSK